MIIYTHDKHGDHYIGLARGDNSVAYTKELYTDENGSLILADIGHDGKLIGVDICMEDEESIFGCCAECNCEGCDGECGLGDQEKMIANGHTD